MLFFINLSLSVEVIINFDNYQCYSNEDSREKKLDSALKNFNQKKQDINKAENEITYSDKQTSTIFFNYLFNHGYDFNEDGEISEEEFIKGELYSYDLEANRSYQNFKIEFVIMIPVMILFVVVIIATIVYFRETDKLIRIIGKYRNFIMSTNRLTIDEISQEFGESAEIIQKNIQIAIDKKILKNVYFSNKDKKIYILDSKSKKPNMNFDYNVNMNIKEENNITIQKDK